MQNYINHIVFVIDASGSMRPLTTQTVKVFDEQVKYLACRSKELDQETRVSVYLFNDDVSCIVYDKDVLRLPSLSSLYNPNGNTALIDASVKAIEDLSKTPELYGDHAFLVYVLTDGEENRSRKSTASALSGKINSLPENWTVAVLVPDQRSAFEAKKFGFPANNIAVWSATEKGLESAGDVIKQATNSFMTSRASGVRSTRSLFSLEAAPLSSVKSSLTHLGATEYTVLPVHSEAVIKPFVESWTKKPYVQGSAYYQLTKPETVQGYKQICVQEKATGKVYSGSNARAIYGLPNSTVRVMPLNAAAYDLFIQSTSTNRKLVAGTKLLVLS